MAFGNPYSSNYAPMYYPQASQPAVPPSTPISAPTQINNSSIIWVQGEAGAKSYLVAPNTTVQLWDSEQQVIYLKSADASGMPTIKYIDYTIRDNSPSSSPVLEGKQVDYVTHEEMDELKRQVEDIRKNLKSVSRRNGNGSVRRREMDDNEE